MELKNLKQEETKRVEVYYERIQKLVRGLQVPTINNLLTIIFRVGLQSYLRNYICKDEVVNITTLQGGDNVV
jgi:hypothetical protein